MNREMNGNKKPQGRLLPRDARGMGRRALRWALLPALGAAVLALAARREARAAEFEVVATSFTVDNQLNVSSAAYFQKLTIAPYSPNTAGVQNQVGGGGLWFDGTNYRAWDTTQNSWVSLATASAAGLINWYQINNFPAVCTGGQVLTGYNANGVPQCATTSGTLSGGSSFAVPVWTGGTSLGVSSIWVNGTGQNSPVIVYATMTVQGSAFSVGGSSFTVGGGSATVAYQLTAGSLSLTGPNGNVASQSSVTAAGFFGNGAGLTGITATDNTKVAKAGDAMTGQLTLYGSTLTVLGNAFSVGGSSFVVSGSSVGINIAPGAVPSYLLQVGSNDALDASSLGLGLGTPPVAGNALTLGGSGNAAFGGSGNVNFNGTGNVNFTNTGANGVTVQGLKITQSGGATLLTDSGGNVIAKIK